MGGQTATNTILREEGVGGQTATNTILREEGGGGGGGGGDMKPYHPKGNGHTHTHTHIYNSLYIFYVISCWTETAETRGDTAGVVGVDKSLSRWNCLKSICTESSLYRQKLIRYAYGFTQHWKLDNPTDQNIQTHNANGLSSHLIWHSLWRDRVVSQVIKQF